MVSYAIRKVIELHELNWIEIRQSQLIEHLISKCSKPVREEDFWGLGIAVYGPIGHNTNNGIKHHFIPCLDIEVNKFYFKWNYNSSITKNNIDEKIKSTIWSWMHHL